MEPEDDFSTSRIFLVNASSEMRTYHDISQRFTLALSKVAIFLCCIVDIYSLFLSLFDTFHTNHAGLMSL